jgi:hypothetical protein
MLILRGLQALASLCIIAYVAYFFAGELRSNSHLAVMGAPTGGQQGLAALCRGARLALDDQGGQLTDEQRQNYADKLEECLDNGIP